MFTRNTVSFGKNKTYTFRSGWEENWSYYLEFRKRQGEIYDWEYEPERYKFVKTEGNYKIELGSYLPDFKVWDTREKFHLEEIKGKEQGMRKLQRMRKYYPEIKLIKIGRAEYLEIKKKLGKILNFI